MGRCFNSATMVTAGKWVLSVYPVWGVMVTLLWHPVGELLKLPSFLIIFYQSGFGGSGGKMLGSSLPVLSLAAVKEPEISGCHSSPHPRAICSKLLQERF